MESSSPIAASAGVPTFDRTAEVYAVDCRAGQSCSAPYVSPEALDAAIAADGPGWPVLVNGPCRGLERDASRSVWAACDSPSGAIVYHFEADGTLAPGGQARFGSTVASVYENRLTISCGDERSALTVAPNGTVFVAVVDGQAAQLYALDPDLSVRAGWPRPFPGDPPGNDGIGGNGCRGFIPAPDGAVLAWGYEGVKQEIELQADRTEFIRYGADGATVAGWPRGSTGAASAPVIDAEGAVSYTSASGKLWRHATDGEIVAGWPYQLEEPEAPILASDGRLAAPVRRTDRRDAVVLLRPDGHAVSGGPIRLPGDIEDRCLFGDAPCIGLIAPTFGAAGELYVALAAASNAESNALSMHGGSIVALDRAGKVVPGWPVQLPERTHAVGLSVDANGDLVVDAARCSTEGCMNSGTEMVTLILGPDGQPRSS